MTALWLAPALLDANTTAHFDLTGSSDLVSIPELGSARSDHGYLRILYLGKQLTCLPGFFSQAICQMTNGEATVGTVIPKTVNPGLVSSGML